MQLANFFVFGFASVAGIAIFGVRMNTARKALCAHIEQHYPDEWEKILRQAKLLGKQSKWVKYLAAEAVKNGPLAQKEDPTLTQFHKQVQRNLWLMVGTPTVCVLAYQIPQII